MDYLNKTKNFGQGVLKGESQVARIVQAVVLIIVIMILVKVIKSIYTGYNKYVAGSPWILKGTKDAKKRMILLNKKYKFL